MTEIPPFKHYENSWMATSPSGRVTEIWGAENLRKVAAANYQIETASQYLGRIHAEVAACEKANPTYAACNCGHHIS